ncbi:discoidin domain-containing protein [Marinigracilibium pacificum]|uniref:T9SS type A sorting domain-containing protein n=1 Tax=Marinigracilibium pacificum TaxID=2729599 RepID=A0A848J2L1_9BACT|nr:discoidin domain-containing protein [Marinigracilibium pacificum]NMM48780.1 T9SS type A sorting domain-containing protein [Marinigracilibium pacificum]
MKLSILPNLKSHIIILYDVLFLSCVLSLVNVVNIYAQQGENKIELQATGNEVMWNEGNDAESVYSLKFKNITSETTTYQIKVVNDVDQPDSIDGQYGKLIYQTDYVFLDTGASEFEWYEIVSNENLIWELDIPGGKFDPPPTPIKELINNPGEEDFYFPFFGEVISLRDFALAEQGGIGYFPEKDGDFFSYEYPVDSYYPDGFIYPLLSVVPQILEVYYKEYPDFAVIQFFYKLWSRPDDDFIYQIKVNKNGDIKFLYKLMEFSPTCNNVATFMGLESLDGIRTHNNETPGPYCFYDEKIVLEDISVSYNYLPQRILYPNIKSVTLNPGEETTIDFYPRKNLGPGNYTTNIKISDDNSEIYQIPIFATVYSNEVEISTLSKMIWRSGSITSDMLDIKIKNLINEERNFIIRSDFSFSNQGATDKFIVSDRMYLPFDTDDFYIGNEVGNNKFLTKNYIFPNIVIPENKLDYPGFYTALGGSYARFGDILKYNNRQDSTFKFTFFDEEVHLKDFMLSEYGYFANYNPPPGQYYPPYDFDPGDMSEPNGIIAPFVGEITFNPSDNLSGIFYDELIIEGQKVAAIYFNRFKPDGSETILTCRLLILRNGDFIIEKAGNFDDFPSIRKTAGIESKDGTEYAYRNMDPTVQFDNNRIFIFRDRFPLFAPLVSTTAANATEMVQMNPNFKAIPGLHNVAIYLDEIVGNDTIPNVAKTRLQADVLTVDCALTDQNLSLNSDISASSSAASWWQPDRMIDGAQNTRWSTTANQAEIIVDLNQDINLDEIKIFWDYARAKSYSVYSKLIDTDAWTLIYSDMNNLEVNNLLLFTDVSSRYLKIVCSVPFTTYGYSIKELEVYGGCLTEPIVPASGEIFPFTLNLKPGDEVQLIANVVDSKGNVIDQPDGEWFTNSGNVNVDVNGLLTALSPGAFTVEYHIGALILTRDGFVSPDDCAISPSDNLALNMPSFGSSQEGQFFEAKKANDGNLSSRWSSRYADNQWYYVELGDEYEIFGVNIVWNYSAASSYELQYRNSEGVWKVFYQDFDADGGTDVLKFETGIITDAIRLWGFERNTSYGISIHEFQVFGSCPSTGASSELLLTGVSAYPNPLGQTLQLKLNTEKTEKYQLKLYDSNFNLYFNGEFELGMNPIELPINISTLPVGVYILKMVSKEGVSTSIKLVKE